MCTKPAKALACALLALALGGCAAAAPTGARHRVAIVAKSTRTEFWLSVFAGAQAAAAEYNVELDISGPETEEDYETQNCMVAEAVDAGAEALVFSAIDYENNAAAIDAAAAAGVRIVAIDSNVDSAAVQTYIGTDNYAAGQMAAQAALDAVDGELTVGIVNYDISSANGQERERGARDLFEESGRAQVAARNQHAGRSRPRPGRHRGAAARPPGHQRAAGLQRADQRGRGGGAVAAQELSDAVFLVGFDSNPATVEGLQNGSVDALIVQNPYAMGYLGVESAYRLLSGQGGSLAPTVDTATSIVDLENLFTMDSQKALFAFEQRES